MMRNNMIYYFSGTGNSLVVARRIAAKLGDTELLSIPQALAKPLPTTVSRVGLVFPIYAWGLPRLVTEFVAQWKVSSDQYVFGVATCGGTAGDALLQLQRALRKNGGRLAAGFLVRAASYTLFRDEAPIITFVRKLDRKPFPLDADARLAEIVSVVRQQQLHPPESSSMAANIIGGLLHRVASKALAKADRDYGVDDRCTQCGTCARICPRGNITLDRNQVLWHHNCEQCMACLQWCPQAAIRHKQETSVKPRTHHPDVTIQEMMVR